MVEKEEVKLCKDCINFIFDGNSVDCDIGYFLKEKIHKAYIYIPEMFDCEDYERMPRCSH